MRAHDLHLAAVKWHGTQFVESHTAMLRSFRLRHSPKRLRLAVGTAWAPPLTEIRDRCTIASRRWAALETIASWNAAKTFKEWTARPKSDGTKEILIRSLCNLCHYLRHPVDDYPGSDESLYQLKRYGLELLLSLDCDALVGDALEDSSLFGVVTQCLMALQLAEVVVDTDLDVLLKLLSRIVFRSFGAVGRRVLLRPAVAPLVVRSVTQKCIDTTAFLAFFRGSNAEVNIHEPNRVETSPVPFRLLDWVFAEGSSFSLYGEIDNTASATTRSQMGSGIISGMNYSIEHVNVETSILEHWLNIFRWLVESLWLYPHLAIPFEEAGLRRLFVFAARRVGNVLPKLWNGLVQEGSAVHALLFLCLLYTEARIAATTEAHTRTTAEAACSYQETLTLSEDECKALAHCMTTLLCHIDRSDSSTELVRMVCSQTHVLAKEGLPIQLTSPTYAEVTVACDQLVVKAVKDADGGTGQTEEWQEARNAYVIATIRAGNVQRSIDTRWCGLGGFQAVCRLSAPRVDYNKQENKVKRKFATHARVYSDSAHAV